MVTVMNMVVESIQGLRLGVVALFGIVVPGIWFWATAVFYLYYLLGGETLGEMQGGSDWLRSFFGTSVAWIVASLVVYVTGSVLRILPPDAPDSLSLRTARISDPKGRIDPSDRFPYASLPQYLRVRGLHGLAALVPWDTGSGGDRKAVGQRSKTFIHFVKLYIAVGNPQLSNQLARQEAFIRLLSGVCYAVLLSIPLLIVAFAVRRAWNELAGFSLGITCFNLLVTLGILHAFHYQRLRELVMILSAYFLLGPLERSPYVDPASNTSGDLACPSRMKP